MDTTFFDTEEFPEVTSLGGCATLGAMNGSAAAAARSPTQRFGSTLASTAAGSSLSLRAPFAGYYYACPLDSMVNDAPILAAQALIRKNRRRSSSISGLCSGCRGQNFLRQCG